MSQNSFGARAALTVGGTEYEIYRLDALQSAFGGQVNSEPPTTSRCSSRPTRTASTRVLSGGSGSCRHDELPPPMPVEQPATSSTATSAVGSRRRSMAL